jgi:biopolymer transport protein ExbB
MQHSLSQFWQQGDWVSHLALLFLVLMSIYSWWVIASQSWRLRRIAKSATALESFWHSSDFETATQQFDTTAYNPFGASAIAIT